MDGSLCVDRDNDKGVDCPPCSSKRLDELVMFVRFSSYASGEKSIVANCELYEACNIWWG